MLQGGTREVTFWQRKRVEGDPFIPKCGARCESASAQVAKLKTRNASRSRYNIRKQVYAVHLSIQSFPLYVKLVVAPQAEGHSKNDTCCIGTAGESLLSPHGSTD